MKQENVAIGDPGRTAEKSLRQDFGLANGQRPPIDHKAEFPGLANARRRVFNPDFSAVGRMVTYSLTLGDRDAFRGLTVVLAARLTPLERAELARAALLSLEDEEYLMLTEAVPC